MLRVSAVISIASAVLFAQQIEVLSWTFRTAAPQPGRCQIQAHGNVRDTIYICGGRPSGAIAIRTVQAYVPAADLWITTLPAMPGPRSHGYGDVIDSIIYAAGGFDSSAVPQTTFWGFNVNTKIWVTLASLPVANYIGAGAAYGGRFYIFGSQNRGDSLLEYNPNMNNWTVRRPTPRPPGRRFAAAAGTANCFYVMGGVDPTGAVLSDCWQFQRMGGGTWTQLANMPGPRTQHAAYAVLGDSIVYVVGGTNGTTTDSMVYKYTIATNTWITDVPMQVSRAMLTLDRAQDKIYAMCGLNGATYFTTNEEGGPYVGSIGEHRTNVCDFDLLAVPSHVRNQGRINYRLERTSHVVLKLYDSAGQVAIDLAEGIQEAGVRTVRFDAGSLKTGVYFIGLAIDEANAAVKILVLK